MIHRVQTGGEKPYITYHVQLLIHHSVHVPVGVRTRTIMTSLSEMKDREYFPNRTYLKMLIGGGLAFSKVFLTNMGDIKKVSRKPSTGPRYVRPTRRYSLPEYTEGMRYFEKNEKYKRPTLWCNSHDKTIIALASQLGAFEKTDYEYAEAAFEWCKRNLELEILKFNEVDETLQRGTGTCIHINSVFAALCRCGGLPARYKMFAAIESQPMYDLYDKMMQKWYAALGYFSIEADIEVLIDGKWVVGHAGPTPERQAGMGIPITKLGEDSLGTWFEAVPGTLFITESVPYGVGLTMSLLSRLGPGTLNSINVNITKQVEAGKKILKAKGGETQYDKEIRAKFKPKFPDLDYRSDTKNIVFER